MSHARDRIQGLKIAPIPPAPTSPTAVVERAPGGAAPTPIDQVDLDDLLDLDGYEKDMAQNDREEITLPPIIDF